MTRRGESQAGEGLGALLPYGTRPARRFLFQVPRPACLYLRRHGGFRRSRRSGPFSPTPCESPCIDTRHRIPPWTAPFAHVPPVSCCAVSPTAV